MMLAGRDVVVEQVEEELELDDAEDEDADDADVDRPAPARRRSRGRRPLPENLPRVEIEVLPPEVVREGLDAFQRIGQVVSEVVERRPASLVVARVVRPKFVRKGEASGTVDSDAPETPAVQLAERLELPIERGLAGPGLLADTIVHRWQDHLPANRLEAFYARPLVIVGIGGAGGYALAEAPPRGADTLLFAGGVITAASGPVGELSPSRRKFSRRSASPGRMKYSIMTRSALPCLGLTLALACQPDASGDTDDLDTTTTATTGGTTDSAPTTTATTDDPPLDGPLPCEGEAVALDAGMFGDSHVDEPDTIDLSFSHLPITCAEPTPESLSCPGEWFIAIDIPAEVQTPGLYALEDLKTSGISGMEDCLGASGGRLFGTLQIIAVDETEVRGRLCHLDGHWVYANPTLGTDFSFVAPRCP